MFLIWIRWQNLSRMQEAQETVLVAPTVYGTSIEFARSVVEFSATYHRFPSGG